MTERKKYDVAVIGSGPGGYVAAIRAAQLGKSVALIEKDLIGGCCLNVGCIPTKTLLSSAAVYHQVKRASDFGISTGPISFHYDQMKQRKDQVISKMRSSLEGLIRSNQITIFRGTAQFESVKTLKIKGTDPLFLEAEKIIIATGSTPFDVKAFPCDHQRILNSTSILELNEAPQSLAIIGGGYIGCEFASLFIELGTKVTLIEALPSLLSAQGKQISDFMTKALKAKGVEVLTQVKVESIQNQGSSTQISLEGGKKIDAEYSLVAVGRKIYTEGLCLEKAGLQTKQRGEIETDDSMQTSVRGIYAIGDVTGKWMLAHVASHQAIVAAEHAAGLNAKMHYEAVPAVIFTSPEVATVGMSVEAAKEKGLDVRSGSFPYQALGKAQAAKETEGFTQIVSDAKTHQILGATVIGYDASNLIAEMALAIQNELTLDSVMQTIHAHPTIAESWNETAWVLKETPLHLPPKAKR